MNTQEVLGLISVVLALVSSGVYILGMVRSDTKPHAFTWLIWATLTAIVFAAQVTEGGGPGAWTMGVSSVLFWGIGIAALKVGSREYSTSDWVCLGLAAVAAGLWAVTADPLGAIILVTLIYLFAFAPTFRKAYKDPFQEHAFSFIINGFKIAIGIAALSQLTVVTALYPSVCVVTSIVFISMLYVRRKVLATRDAIS